MIGKALVIWAFVTVALSASAQTTPIVTSKLVTVSNRKYTVHDYADPAAKKFCVVIPEGLKTVRGLLVQCNYAGGDSRGDWTFCNYYREFMHLHDFALVASAGDIPHVKAFQAFRDCLQRVSVASRHPELVNAPYAAVGFSAGGGFASTLMTRDPDRTIAAGIIEARYNFTAFLPPNPPPPLPSWPFHRSSFRAGRGILIFRLGSLNRLMR